MSELHDYRILTGEIADVIGVSGYLPGDLPRLVRDWGSGRYDAGKASLPEPDATNPDHLYWVASVLHKAGWPGVAADVDAEADRLSAEQAAELERLDEVAHIIHQYDECLDAARALDAAGLLRGGGRGE